MINVENVNTIPPHSVSFIVNSRVQLESVARLVKS